MIKIPRHWFVAVLLVGIAFTKPALSACGNQVGVADSWVVTLDETYEGSPGAVFFLTNHDPALSLTYSVSVLDINVGASTSCGDISVQNQGSTLTELCSSRTLAPLELDMFVVDFVSIANTQARVVVTYTGVANLDIPTLELGTIVPTGTVASHTFVPRLSCQ